MTGARGESHGRMRRRRWLWATCAVTVVGVAAAGSWTLLRDPESAHADESARPGSTTEVSKRTITKTETWTGTLGHGTPASVAAADSGTVTRLAAQGSPVRRGTELYRLDEEPVVAMVGKIPMYRELSDGAEGRDVHELERNLAALGYDGFDVDDEFTSYTALAVQDWQEDLGVDETGVVGPGDVVFLPSLGRVGTLAVEAGTPVSPGAEVLEVDARAQIVDFEADPEDRDLVDAGTDLRIQLPGGGSVEATVTDTAVTASDESSGAEGAGSDDTVVEVEAALGKRVAPSLMGSPVDVEVVVERRKDVLVVPVNALLALAEGGYGLEVVAGDDSTLVPVETGLFADGGVEVRGKRIDEGTIVGVPGE